MRPLPRRFRPRGEDAFRARSFRGTRYFRSRQRHDDLTIAIERFPGPEDVPARSFVLVHGIGVSSRYFRPLARELAKRGRVYLVDLPGYGAAPDPRRDVTLADHAAVLAGFLRESRLENPVLVGHSMGAQVVSVLAERHPDVSDRIVALAPTLPPESRSTWRAIGTLLRDGTREPFRVIVIAVTDYLVRCGLPYLWRQLPHLIGDRLEDRIPKHAAPTLVITGHIDPVVPVEWGRMLAERGPTTRFVQVRGPHVIMHTDPVTIARHIAGFTEAG